MQDVVLYLIRRARWVFLCAVISGAIGFGLSNLLTKTYASSALIKMNEGAASGLSSLLGNLPVKGLLPDAQVGNESEGLFLGIISSREVLIPVVKQYRLDTVYQKKSLDQLLELFQKNISVETDENSLISCSVEFPDSQGARNVLRTLLEAATKRQVVLQKAQIHDMTSFLRDRENDLRDSIEISRDRILEFYKKHKVMNVERQIEFSLHAMAMAEEDYAAVKAQGIMENSTFGPGNSASATTAAKLSALQSVKQKMLTESGVLIDPRQSLSLALEEKSLKEQLLLYASAFQLVVKERLSTEAKLNSQIAPLQIIQAPYVPDRKLRPKRIMYLLAGFLAGGIISAAIFILQGVGRGELLGNDSMRQYLFKCVNAWHGR